MLMFSAALQASKEVANQALATTATVQDSVMAVPPLASSEDQLIQVSLSLVVVLAVIYAVAWLVKRNRGIQGLTGLPMKTLAVLPMGVKEKIILIEVGGKQILLGMTAHNINTLASFDEPILVIKDKNPKGFAERLKEIMSQVKQDNLVAEGHDSASSPADNEPPFENKTSRKKP